MAEEEDKNAKPFFSRYLEGQVPNEEQKTEQQISDEELENVAGGDKQNLTDDMMTKKFPSDNEGSEGTTPVMTLKYPSDREDL